MRSTNITVLVGVMAVLVLPLPLARASGQQPGIYLRRLDTGLRVRLRQQPGRNLRRRDSAPVHHG